MTVAAALIWVHEGKRIGVGLEVLAEIIAKYLVTARPEEDHEGKCTVVFDPVRPDQTTLLALIREEGGLARRLPRSKPTGLTMKQEQEIKLRLQRGERALDLARMFGCEAEAIGQLGR